MENYLEQRVVNGCGKLWLKNMVVVNGGGK
jgi:hypothetical protein